MAQQVPSTEYLVVKPEPEAGDVRDALAELGEVEAVDGGDLLILRLDETSHGLDAAREHLLDEADVAWAEPLLLDERDEPHVPTGEVTVRFAKSLSGDELEAFARGHGLRLQRRNEFVAEQATFARVEPRSSSLTVLVRELEAAPEVQSAWANTMSRYQRA